MKLKQYKNRTHQGSEEREVVCGKCVAKKV
jgi:hypothetical protein